MRNKSINIFMLGLVTLLTTLILISFQKEAYSIPITPFEYFENVRPGDTLEGEIIVYGKTEYEESFLVYPEPVEVVFTDEDGSRDFYPIDKDDCRSGMACWIEIEESELTINPGEDTTLHYRINVPDNVTCGTKYAAIAISNEPPQEYIEGAVLRSKSIMVSQLHMNLNIPEENCVYDSAGKLLLNSFYVTKNPPIYGYENVNMVTRLHNQGDFIVRSPRGYIEIEGFNFKETLDFNELDYNVYPNSYRIFENSYVFKDYPEDGNFKDKLVYELLNLRFGKYTARLGITKNVSPAITSEVSFWIFPFRIILVIISFLLTYLIYKLVRRRLDQDKKARSGK